MTLEISVWRIFQIFSGGLIFFPYKGYDRRRPIHDPTDSYFYLAIHLAKCMAVADALNFDNYPLIMKMTGT